MHSNAAHISYLLLEFFLLTLNRQMVAARPEVCIIEKVVAASRLHLYCEYYRLNIMSLPNFSNSLPCLFQSPIIKDPRVGQNEYPPY